VKFMETREQVARELRGPQHFPLPPK